jgi:PAS domain S-box-containing protein
MIGRAATLIFALLLSALSCATVLEIFYTGQPTLVSPSAYGLIAVIGTGVLFSAIAESKAKARHLGNQTGRLEKLSKELEQNVTALRKANKELHESEVRYRGLVDSQGDAIVRRSPDGRVSYANEAFCALFGLRPDDVLGRIFQPEMNPESPPPLLGYLAGREIGRERASYDQHVKTVAGYRWLAWEDYAVRDADGQLSEIQSVGRDITSRKQLEVDLRLARDKAEEANRAKSRFLATMSHEIRTPMNGVLGMARLLMETSLAPDQKTYADAIQQSGVSLLSLIEDILDFSKIESGALMIDQGDVALRLLIEGVAELLAPRAQARGLEIATAIAPGVPETIRGDTIRLRQILTNLVGNAVKFTEEGGVLISAELERNGAQGNWLRLCVRDTGIGVPLEKRELIFEDFAQADSSHARRFEGTGLGLAISKRLVDAMGGSIGVTDAPGKGSLFWVRLPLDAGASAKERPQTLSGKKIGVITVCPILREGLIAQLRTAGAAFRTADSLGVLAKENFDLVLVDIPSADGKSLPDLLKNSPPAIALLPLGRRENIAVISTWGAMGFLSKPIRQKSLESRISAILAGNPGFETASAPVAAPARKQGASLSVLLAEDNPVNALLARELLRRRGHVTTAVTTGEAAVEACADGRYDLVIMDLHMPGLDGIEATQRIRQAEAETGRSHVPIIALTADALETGRKACLMAGMDGFLTKPVDPAELDEVLATIKPAATVAA